MATRTQHKTVTTIRPLEPGDREGMIGLFEKTFRRPMGPTESQEHWVWEYEKGPWEPTYALVCEADDKIVGGQGNLPLRFKVGEREVIGCSSFDSMVDSDYRGHGIFTRIVDTFQESAYERGVCLSYSFPNEKSLPIYVNRLGRTSLNGYIVLRHPLRRKQLLQKEGVQLEGWILKTLAQVRLRGAKIALADGFDARFDALWEAAKDQVQVGIVRNSQYLDWRFAQKPEADHTTYVYQENGSISGYVVLKQQTDEQNAAGMVMDVLALPGRKDVVEALFAQTFRHFIREQAGQVRFGTMEQGPYTQTVRHLFSNCRERPLCAQVYGGIEPEFVLDGANWFISFADTDFF